MKKLGKEITAGVVALLALSCACNATADDPATSAQQPPNQAAPGGYENQNRTSEGMPMKCNKASSLIGMDVENQDGEHLGHVTDIVFDLKSDRVSYVVMTTASKVTLGIREKLLAVPLSAFATSSDQKRLVLNADRSKLEAAAGFTMDNWPDVGNPSWGAQPFWQNPNGQPAKPNNPQANPNNPNGTINQNNQPNNQPNTQNPTTGTRPGEQGNPPKTGQ